MSIVSQVFRKKYGPWALVAGASEGIGAAFAEELAEKGMKLVLVARRPELLDTQAESLNKKYGTDVRTVSLDLSARRMLDDLINKTEDIQIGMLIYNAAFSTIGSFFKFPLEDHFKLIDVNCRGPVSLVHFFGKQMMERNTGGIILMSSMTAFQGSPLHSHYGATKAYNLALAEGLWFEMKKKNVDIMACCAGATSTPNYINSKPGKLGFLAPKPLPPETVAREALDAFGDKHSFIPGKAYRLSRFFMGRLMSRTQAINIMGNTAEKMYGE